MIKDIKFKIQDFRYKVAEKIYIWIAWHLPKKVVAWATVRAGAHATTGRYSDTIVPDLGFMEVLNRWDKQ